MSFRGSHGQVDGKARAICPLGVVKRITQGKRKAEMSFRWSQKAKSRKKEG